MAVDEVAALTKDVVLKGFACTRDSVTPGTVWVTGEPVFRAVARRQVFFLPFLFFQVREKLTDGQ